VELIGTSAAGQYVSGLFTLVYPEATGVGGNLTVETGRLSVRDGAAVNADTYGFGAGGSLTVRASELVELIGTSADGQFPSGLSTSVRKEPRGLGQFNGRNWRLSVRDGAAVLAQTYGFGAGGSLTVRASELVELSGTSADGQSRSALSTSVWEGATGAAGNLTVETQRLIVRDIAAVLAENLWLRGGGSLTVRASELVELSGTSADGQFPSGLYTSVWEGATGAAGNLTVETQRLIVWDGAVVSTIPMASGRGELWR
jgi:hypothetical protein